MAVPFRGRLSRRGFLAASSAAAWAPMLGAPAIAATTHAVPGGNAKIAIVGAGIAGLTAARALADRGIHATVFEAQHRIGGRMHSETAFWENGQTSEYGGELIDTDHTLMQALVKRFGLELTDVLADEGARVQTIDVNGAYYPERQLFRDFRPVYEILAEQVRAAGPVTTYRQSTAAARTRCR